MLLAFFFAFFPGCSILCPDKPTALDKQYVANVAQVRILAQHALANLPEFSDPANAVVRQAYIDKMAAMEEYEAVILESEP
jgi:hypothetical protein